MTQSYRPRFRKLPILCSNLFICLLIQLLTNWVRTTISLLKTIPPRWHNFGLWILNPWWTLFKHHPEVKEQRENVLSFIHFSRPRVVLGSYVWHISSTGFNFLNRVLNQGRFSLVTIKINGILEIWYNDNSYNQITISLSHLTSDFPTSRLFIKWTFCD